MMIGSIRGSLRAGRGSVRAALGVAMGLVVGTAPQRCDGQAPAPPPKSDYTSLDAGRDAYYQHDARRLAQINNQIGLNQRMRWEGWISSYYPGVFQAWPMTPGVIWGYPIHLGPARQSVGQHSYQAGPNRWISEPVYPEDAAQAEAAALAAEAAQPGGAAGANSAGAEASSPAVDPAARRQARSDAAGALRLPAAAPGQPQPPTRATGAAPANGLPPWLLPLLEPNRSSPNARPVAPPAAAAGERGPREF